MRFEWDEEKRRSNLRKHGMDFVDAVRIFEGITVTILDDRFDYGDTRFVSLGLLQNTVIVLAHTETDEVVRVISARKATKNEAKAYYRQIAD